MKADEFMKPPFLARMLERAGKFTDGLDDKNEFLRIALAEFENLCDKIKTSNDVLHRWSEALGYAACSRPRWLVHSGSALEKTKWVRGVHLGRQ